MAPNLPLAGRCAVAPGVTVGDPLRAELRAALVARSRDPATDLRARIDAALALGPLGDPRFERRTGPFGTYLLPPLVTVAGGTYRLGAATSQESHETEVRLPTFAIGQFAVTNAEYQCFMDGGGYEDERWWEGDAARAWRNGEGTDQAYRRMWRGNHLIWRSWPDSQITKLLEAGQIGQEDAEEWTMIRAMDDAAFESWLDSGSCRTMWRAGATPVRISLTTAHSTHPCSRSWACAGTRRAPTARGSRRKWAGPTGCPPSTSGRRRRAARLAGRVHTTASSTLRRAIRPRRGSSGRRPSASSRRVTRLTASATSRAIARTGRRRRGLEMAHPRCSGWVAARPGAAFGVTRTRHIARSAIPPGATSASGFVWCVSPIR